MEPECLEQDQRFAEQADLQKHTTMLHGPGKVFQSMTEVLDGGALQCKFCDRRVNRQRSLNEHFRAAHDDIVTKRLRKLR
jgi:hypothetical protein